MTTTTKLAVQLPLALGLPLVPTLPSTLDEESLAPEVLAGLFAFHNIKPCRYEAIHVNADGSLSGCALGALVEHEDIAYTPENGYLRTTAAIQALTDTGKYSWFFLTGLFGGFDGISATAEAFIHTCCADLVAIGLDGDDDARLRRGYALGQATRAILDAAGA